MPALAQRAPAPTNVVPPLSYTHRVLRNGLDVYTMRDTRTANVSVQMWYDVGSKDDPAGRSGFAHLFEHILSRVTRNIPHGELNRLVEEQAGGTRNALTGLDRTYYYETVPANHLEAMLWAHAERMGRSVLDQQVFEAERNAVKEEMRQSFLLPPYGRLQGFYAFDTGFTGHHPYRRPSIGTVADLDAATLEEARAFHANFYRPDNATLIVSGNFDPAQLNRWIARHLGGLRRPTTPILRNRVIESPRSEPRSLTVYAPNVPLPAVRFTWQRPRLNHADSAAFAVIDKILGGGQSSRLYRTLVHERQLATSVNTFNSAMEDAGLFGIQAIVASGRDIGEIETALAAEIARLRDQPVTAAELEEARNELVSQALFGRETPPGRAIELGNAVTTANDPRWGDKLLAAVQRVTAADVQRVARTWFADSRRVSLRYLNETQRPANQAAYDPSVQASDPAFGRSYPLQTAPPNQLASEGERTAPPAPQPAQPFTAPLFAERRLPNGMRVVIARSTDVPIASALLVFGGGTAADPAARPGIASMVSSLVDNGAGGMTAQQIAARIESLGAQIGSSVNQDSSIAFVSAPTATIEAAGALLAQVVRDPAFAQEELERERRRLLDQFRVSMRNPSYVMQRAGLRAMYGDAPYGTPPEGTPASLAALSREDLVAYHRDWWRPDNATLVVTGALDAEAGFALAERLFGNWTAPAQAMPQMPASRAGQALAPRVVVVDNPDADQTAVAIVTRAIARNDSDYYPLALANSALGGSQTARLFQEVRVRRALSYGANSSLLAFRDEGVLVASAQTRNNAVPEVVQVLMAELRRMREEPITADVLGRRRTLLIGDFARQVATTNGLGNFLADLAVHGLPMSEYARYIASLQAVTPEQVTASVAAEIDPARATLIIIGRASEFLEPLRAQHPTTEVIPIAEVDFGSPSLRRKAP
ncbi:MAG TPA: pitrilysin family protein [Thermoanaerobaculia bacterium]